MTLFGFFGQLGFWEIMIIAVIGVLLFGRRLPEVGRYLGKGIIEFKKGLKGIEDDVETTASAQPNANYPQVEAPRPPQRITSGAPKFQDQPVDSEGTARYQG
jgi:sec-independent protein translocase protein TatA